MSSSLSFSSSLSPPSSDRICVSVRLRPASDPATAAAALSSSTVWLVDAEAHQIRLHREGGMWAVGPPHPSSLPPSPPSSSLPSSSSAVSSSAVFQFDRVFPPSTLDDAVYEGVVAPLVEGAVRGINGTVFAYGQTSSGKTHTMGGMTQLTAHHLFQLLARMKAEGQVEAVQVTASFFEVYNEQLRDLLASASTVGGRRLRVREHPTLGVQIAGLSEEAVTDSTALLRLAAVAERHKAVASTAMNERSSRAHSLCRLHITSAAHNQTRHSVLQLIDLAGSERCSVSCTTGVRLKEGGHINRSLLTLSSVIAKLSQLPSNASSSSSTSTSSSTSSAPLPPPHIPYRDSILTRILEPALGGNSRTAIIACINESALHVDESVSTLRFAVQAKALRTCARVNCVVDPKDAFIAQLQRQLDAKAEAERRWRLKFHRLSAQVHHNTEEEDGDEDGDEERGHSQGAVIPLVSATLPSSVTSPAPLLSAISEGDGAEEDAAREEWKDCESRLRSRLTDLYCHLQSLHRSPLRAVVSPPSQDGVHPLSQAPGLFPVSPSPALPTEELVERLSRLVLSTFSRAEEAKRGLAEALHSTRHLKLFAVALRSCVVDVQQDVAEGLQHLRLTSAQQLQAVQAQAEERCAGLRSQLLTAREEVAETSALAASRLRRCEEAEVRVVELGVELQAVTAELARTRKQVPTPALLQQLARATRSMQLSPNKVRLPTPECALIPAVGKENRRPSPDASKPL